MTILHSSGTLAAIALCALALGCNTPLRAAFDGASAPPDAATAVIDARAIDASVGPLLATHSGCPPTLFADGTVPQDFSSAAAYAAHWTGGWVQPKAAAGVLAFGPHPMTMSWWENYSPTTSNDKPGDVLVCARLRMTTDGPGVPADNTFELTMRVPKNASFETSGMALDVEANAEQVLLRTRTGSNTWTTYDTEPLAMAKSTELTYEIILFGQGSRFLGEVKNVQTGQIAVLRATATLDAGGPITMVGWRNRAGAYVEGLTIGQPSLAIADALAAELPK